MTDSSVTLPDIGEIGAVGGWIKTFNWIEPKGG